jgi:hypothetical protein
MNLKVPQTEDCSLKLGSRVFGVQIFDNDMSVQRFLRPALSSVMPKTMWHDSGYDKLFLTFLVYAGTFPLLKNASFSVRSFLLMRSRTKFTKRNDEDVMRSAFISFGQLVVVDLHLHINDSS